MHTMTSLIHCLDSRFFSVNAHGKRRDVIVYGFEPILPAHKNIWAEYYIIAFPKLPKLNQNWFTRKVGSNSGENVVRKSMLEYRLIRKQVDEVSLIHMVSKMYVIFLCRKRLLVIELLPQPQNLWFSRGVSHCRINCTNFFSGNLFKPHKQEYLVTNSESLVFMAYLSLPPLSQVCILPGGEGLGTAPCKLCSWVSLV